MFLYFFLVITVFWILKPVKKALFVGYYGEDTPLALGSWLLTGAEAEQLAKVANMVVAFGAVAVFTALARRLHRQQLTYVFAGFSALVLLAFVPLVRQPSDLSVWSLYLFGDLFNTLMVATFFAFLNDSVAPEHTKRLYGPIILGGVAGGAFGSLVVAVNYKALSAEAWMLICAGLVVVIALAAQQAGRRILHRAPAAEGQAPGARGSAALEGARLVFRSRYLLAIVAIVGLYEIVSTILDYQFTASVVHYLDEGERGQHFATVGFVLNGLALAVQIFLTSAVMSRLGVRAALLIMPVVVLGNSGLFLVLPLLWIGSFLSISDNALNYSINQSARESLYTPTTRDEKYKAKAFIDMFVQRFAKSIAVGVNLALAAVFGTFGAVRWLSLIAIALVAVWLVAASYAGRRFQALTGSARAKES